MVDSEHFFDHLPICDSFTDLVEPNRYVPLPEDWHILVADICGSTQAIAQGRYREVNFVGVSVIAAVMNAVKPADIPYVFGGDGAVLCVPLVLLPPARQALLAAQQTAEKAYGLTLRAGVVPMHAILAAGKRVLVARFRVSKDYVQPAFAGGGLAFAESLLKDPATQAAYALAPAAPQQADYTGLECRWQPIPSPRGETVALICQALASTETEQAAIYRNILNKIQELFGGATACHPIAVSGLHLAMDSQGLAAETRLHAAAEAPWRMCLHNWRLRLANLLGLVFMRFRWRIGGVNWGAYREEVVANADVRKFDGALREVLSGTTAQREALEAFLESLASSGMALYGLHVSKAALMTCFVRDRNGRHIHFVDGMDGGYAMAAAALKRRRDVLVIDNSS